MHFAAVGYPPMSDAKSAPAEAEGIRSILVIGRSKTAKNSAAELLQMKTESTINGKSEGITEYEQRESPYRIPSDSSALLKSSITPKERARRAVRKL